MKWKVLAIVVLLVGGSVAVGASLGVFGASAATAATDYLTAEAAVADVVDEVAATGAVAPSATYGLAFGSEPAVVTGDGPATEPSTITWPVTKVNVKVGDRVTKGQVLATAATTDLDAQIDDANRQYWTAQIQLAQAEALVADATASDAIRQARIGLYGAQGSFAHAKATLLALKSKSAQATLTAPVDGLVTAVSIAAGADAPTGDAIQVAADPLQVTTSVVESDITSITVGQTANVTVAALAAATIVGTVAAIAPTATSGNNSGVVSFDVTISLIDAPAGLRPGMSADVTITTASAPGVLAIPARALQGSLGAYRVRILAADGTVSTRDVTVGLITSSLVEIKSGLQAGDVVITGTSSSQNSNSNQNVRSFPGTGPGGGVQVIKGG